MAEHNDFGKEAEGWAVDFLEKKGYRILKRNFRYQKAEVDIIAEYENQIIIIEVKARAYNTITDPKDAVNKKKMRLLAEAADYFMQENDREEDVRFDIISILQNKDKGIAIQHIENAFEIIDI